MLIIYISYYGCCRVKAGLSREREIRADREDFGGSYSHNLQGEVEERWYYLLPQEDGYQCNSKRHEEKSIARVDGS